MNKVTTIWQRLGALLLAFVLVVSMLPVGAMAGFEIGAANRLSAELVRTDNKNGTYTYTVNFVTGNVAPGTADYYWCPDVNTADTSNGDDGFYTGNRTGAGTAESPFAWNTKESSYTSVSKHAGLKVVVDGMWVKVTIPDTMMQDEYGVTRYTATWATKSALPTSVQVGVPFAVTYTYECVEAQGSASEANYMSCGGGDPIFEDSFTGATVEQLSDGRYVAKSKSDTKTLSLTRLVKTGSTFRGTETRTASIKDTEFKDIQFNGIAAVAGATTYVTSDPITLSVKCGVEDVSFMPNLGETISWNKAADGTWSAVVTGGEEYTIGGKVYKAVVDANGMNFSGAPVAYVDNGKTYVEFGLTSEPTSGIASVTLAGQGATCNALGKNKWSCELATALSDAKQTLVVTNGASATASALVEIIPDLTVTVQPNGDVFNGQYVGNNDLKVDAGYKGTITFGEQQNTGAGSRPLPNLNSYDYFGIGAMIVKNGIANYAEKKWTFTDELGRIRTGTVGKYTLDDTAPVITITGTTDGLTNQNATVQVTIADGESGVNAANSSVKYMSNGVEKTAVLSGNAATIQVAAGETLTQIIVHAEDNVGNQAQETKDCSLTVDGTAPEVELSISAKTITTKNGQEETTDNAIIGTYENGVNTWLVLSAPVTDTTAANTKFTLTASVKDDVAMPDDMTGWTKDDNTGVWTKDIEVTAVANHREETVTLSVPVIKDKAGNAPDSLTIKIAESQIIYLKKNTSGTAYEATVHIDRRYPGDGANGTVPNVIFTTTATPKTTVGGVELYNESSLTFSVNVVDNGSGVGSENYSFVLKDDGNIAFLDGSATQTPPTIMLTSGGNDERNDLSLELTIADNVGNRYTYVHTFAFDNLAPRLTFAFNKDYQHKSGGAYYFKEDVTATVTVEELNFDSANTTVTHNGNALQNNGQAYTVNYINDGTYNLSAASTDLAGNSSGKKTHEIGETFILDKTAPTILVTQTNEDADGVKHSGTDTHYYNGTVTYNFTVADAHLTTDGGSAEIRYTISGTETTETVLNLSDLTVNSDNNSYTHTFTLTNGQKLTALSVYAKDNAGNEFVINPSSTAGLFDDNGVYTGGTVIVDTTAPVVKIEKSTDGTLTEVDGVELYNKDVIYTIKVTDANLDINSEGAVYTVSYTYTDAEGNSVTAEKAKDAQNGWVMEGNAYQYVLKLEDGQRLTDAAVTVKDAAGNVPTASGSVEWELTSGVISYTGADIVVDTTAPAVDLSFKSLTDDVELQSYYMNNGVAYLKLSQPTKTGIGVPTSVKVQATLTITDNNLSTKSGITNTLAGADQTGAWTLGTENYTVINNSNGSVTYTRTMEVETNKTAAMELNFKIQDLVNNVLTADGISIDKVNNTTSNFLAVDSGKLTGTITLDRRQPTSGNDTDTPVITLYPEPAALTNATALSYDLKVNDGEKEKEKENAGLKKVTWAVTADSFITPDTSNAVTEYTEYELQYNKTIAIEVGKGEQNDVTLNVTAEDNVGNQITYQKVFGVDTLAPRVTVTCDNDVVRNDKYFNKARIITITVTELNFDAANTVIETKGGKFSGWTTNGNVHTATVSYTTDGTYSLSMVVKDLAGNTTSDDQVTYNMVRPKDFVVDLTKPVIHVTYNPANASGTYKGVLYYDEVQNVTVTIDELNFDIKGLHTNFTQGGAATRHALSAFTQNGIKHTAYVDFLNGNNYRFTIEFQDLAGNLAETYTSPTFSVDTNEPEIEILNANVSQEYLQPLADELRLTLQVTDKERNLAECNLVLTHLNNAFKKEVVSGNIYYSRSSTDENYQVTFTFKDFPYEKLYDGIYTVELQAKDHAGNTVNLTPAIRFSMNRFGSTFFYGNEFTENYLHTEDGGIVYRNSMDENLVIQEINPNRVYNDADKKTEGATVTVVVNGQSKQLVEGKDYKMTVEKAGNENSNWYIYTYEIFSDSFKDGKDLVNGKYSIVLYSVDEAGNSNTNTLETVDGDEVYTAKMEFVLDTIAPVIITTGIESGEIYDATSKQMEIEISDSTPATIQVYVNGQVVSLSQSNEVLPEDGIWLVQDDVSGIYTLNVPEQNKLFNTQDVKIQALDAANNAAEETVKDFTITTNWFVRFVNSGWLMIVIAILAAAGLVGVIVIKKKKKAAV